MANFFQKIKKSPNGSKLRPQTSSLNYRQILAELGLKPYFLKTLVMRQGSI